MNNLVLFVGDNFADVEREIISKIDVKDFEKHNIVFVPNISSKNIVQQKIFDLLNIKATMNVEITTIQNFLIENILTETDEKVLSPVEKHLFTKQAMLNVQNKLKIFGGKTVSNGLVEKIVDEINRFEENEITTEILKKQSIKNEMQKNKIEDLTLIYEEYQNLTKNKITFKFLLKNKEKIKNKLKNCNFYFLNYLNLNKNEIDFLKFISQNANYSCFGMCENPNYDNDYIFNNNLKAKILNLQDDNLKIEISNIKNTQTENQKLLNCNLFSFSTTEESVGKNFANFLQIFEALDPKTEVQNVARIIKRLLFENKAKTLGDFVVLCSDVEKYKEEIESVFTEYNFKACFDCGGEKITNLQITNFVINIFEYLATKNFEIFVEKIALSNFSNLSSSEKNILVEYLQKNEVTNGNDILKNSILFKPITDLQNILFEIENLKPTLILEKILEKFNIEEKIKNLQNKGKIEIANFSKKALLQIQNLCQQIEDNCENYNIKNFAEDLKFFAEKISISTNVMLADSVYVGSVNNCVQTAKFLFVLGANEGVLPAQANDTAILTDGDLKTIKDFENVLSVKEKNRVSRLQVFKALTNFEENLYISYSLSDATGQKLLPSGFIENLNNLAPNKNLIQNLMYLGGKELDEKSLQEKAKYWAKIFGTKHNAEIEVYKDASNKNLDMCQLMPSLKKVVGFVEDLLSENEELNCDRKELFFGTENKTKVSQIESYYSCPFKHFMQYGIKLREEENWQLKNQHFGQILHKVAELFFKPQNDFVQKIKAGKKTFEEAVEEIFSLMKSEKNFEKLFFETNKFSLKIVKQEALRLCKHLFYSTEKSAYKPKYLEVFFGRENNKFEMKILDTNFSLVGVVDRVDVCGNNDIIIDYKTSSSTKGNCEELFYGEKVQIFAYAKALQEVNNLQPQGVFYLPILNKFDEEKKLPYMLRGKFVNDETFVKQMDTTLSLENRKSTIFPCELKKELSKTNELQIMNARGGKNPENKHVSNEDFNAMMDYAIKMIENAIKEIWVDGNIEVNPNVSACLHCPYLAICQKGTSQKIRGKNFDVGNETFGGVLKGEENGN